MPFPALNATGFLATEDSSQFIDIPIDPAMKYDTDGGLVVSRKRFTRDAGNMLTTGFTFITQADKLLLDAFYKSMGGAASAFTYVHPLTGVSLSVRFNAPWTAAYKGAGTNFRWDITSITLRTA